MTKMTALNLEEQIEEISAKLDILQTDHQHPSPEFDDTLSNGEPTTAKKALDQKASLEQCLSVCQQLLTHINTIKPVVFENTEDAPGMKYMRGEEVTLLGPRLISNALELCSQNLKATERHIRDLQDGPQGGSQSRSKSDEARVMQQLESAQKCLDIVKDAQQHRVNIFENIDTAEDSRQFIVSTIGDLIKATGLTIGARAVNIMGQMNDESLQKMVDNYPSATHSRDSVSETGVTFEKRHGLGKAVQQSRS